MLRPATRIVIAVAAIALCFVAARSVLVATPGPPSLPPEGVPPGVQAAKVGRVIDGDTIAVRAYRVGPVLGSRTPVTIRLLEIDTPETVHPTKPVQCYGREASSYTKHLLKAGTTVWVLGDRERRDRYGRYLLYVWTASGVFANEDLVMRGYARSDLFEPNDRFIDVIRSAEQAARAARRGLWVACSAFAVPSMSAWDSSDHG